MVKSFFTSTLTGYALMIAGVGFGLVVPSLWWLGLVVFLVGVAVRAIGEMQ